ncbi:MAG: trehalase family glycosidase [Verrucomicrobiota bacterium]
MRLAATLFALLLAAPLHAAEPPPIQRGILEIDLHADATARITPEAHPLDALGTTDWFQGMWPSDASMPQPKFPRFHVEPVEANQPGVLIAKKFPLDEALDVCEPTLRLSLASGGKQLPFFSGGPQAQIAYRVGNLLRLVDTSQPVARALEMIVVSHRLLLLRVRLAGEAAVTLRLDLAASTPDAEAGNSGKTLAAHSWVVGNARGWHGVELFAGQTTGEALIVAVNDAVTPEELAAALSAGRQQMARFDGLWAELATAHAIAPFLIGKETPETRNLIAACVNRVLRNARGGGFLRSPSMVEFYAPEWQNADAVWVCFQPACRYALWIEPALWANSMRSLLEQQAPDGRVPQCVYSSHEHWMRNSQIPNISPCLRDYYVFTHDRGFLADTYPRLKNWYGWWLAQRNPTGDGIIAVGTDSQNLWEAICEYKDNHTDPAAPDFLDTCNPLTRSTDIGARPNRVYLPDIVACQARMAEDLSFMAQELGLTEDAARFAAEYQRVRDWANKNLWDEGTRFYYPVERATGRKIMKRSNVAFWLLWAGIPDARQKDALVAAMFDPQQFFTAIPLPMIALNDPSFNPKVGHWGDGYVWPIDVFHAFDGLLRYGEWDRAAQLASHYNRGVFNAMRSTYQPNEFYHHSGRDAGNPLMGTAGCLPLTFQRYLRDHASGNAPGQWSRFAPAPSPAGAR